MESPHHSPSQTTRWWPSVPTLMLLLVAGTLFVLHARYYWPWLEDDAFISFRYAANLVQGHGLVFNPGEAVEGYSNFAWVLLAGGALKLGLNPATVAQTVGILSGLIALFLAWRLALALNPRAGLTAVLAPFFLAMTPLLPRHAVTGLETVPYTALLVLGLFLSRQSPTKRINPLLPLVLLALALLRPEGIAFALLILIWRVGCQAILGVFPQAWRPVTDETPAKTSTSARAELLVFLVLFGAYFLWRWQYFGALMPNTFHAKMTGDTHAVIDGLNYSLDFLRENGGAVVVGLFAVGLLTGRPRLVAWPLSLVVIAQAGFVILAGGDWMHFYRFWVPAMPLLAAGMAAGLGHILLPAQPRRGTLTTRIIVGLVLLTGFVNIYKTERATDRLVMPAVKSGDYLTDAYTETATWLVANTTPEATVAASDIGILGYTSQRHIIDMFGLVDLHIARTPGRQHFKSDARYVLDRQPDIIILITSGTGQYLRIPDAKIYGEPDFHQQYRLAHMITMGFRDETVQIFQRLGQ